MQGESYLNPGKGEDSNSKSGYGLVQWTPKPWAKRQQNNQ